MLSPSDRLQLWGSVRANLAQGLPLTSLAYGLNRLNLEDPADLHQALSLAQYCLSSPQARRADEDLSYGLDWSPPAWEDVGSTPEGVTYLRDVLTWLPLQDGNLELEALLLRSGLVKGGHVFERELGLRGWASYMLPNLPVDEEGDLPGLLLQYRPETARLVWQKRLGRIRAVLKPGAITLVPYLGNRARLTGWGTPQWVQGEWRVLKLGKQDCFAATATSLVVMIRDLPPVLAHNKQSDPGGKAFVPGHEALREFK